MFDDGMYPMTEDGGDQEKAASVADAAVEATQALYQLAASNDLPPPPAQEPLRVLPPPPVILGDEPAPRRARAPHPNPHREPHPHFPSPGFPHPGMHPGHHPGHPRPPPPGLRGLGDDTPESASNLLGLALVAVPVGGYVGGRYAGALGILGGMLAAGGLVNGIRAGKGLVTPPADPSETWVSATFAVLGLGAAAYLIYRGHGHGSTTKPFQENRDASKKKTEYAAAPKRLGL